MVQVQLAPLFFKGELETLCKTEFAEQYGEIIEPLEFIVAEFYRDYNQMSDHDVLHAYEALLKYIKAKITNYPLPQIKLQDISLELFP